MKKWVIFVIVFILLIVGVIGYALIKGGGSFKFSFSSAKITDAKFSTFVDEDQNPIDITSTFNPDSSKIYIWFSWAYTMIGTEAKAVLIYETSDLTITEGSIEIEDMAGRGSFSFTRPATEAGWPIGDYRVDLYLDDELAKSVSFEVILPPETANDCEELTDSDARDKCYFTFALEDKDDSLCEQIIENIPKSMCHAVVLDNADLCEEITDSDGKDICYGTYAIQNNDNSICEKIIDNTKKNICQNIVS